MAKRLTPAALRDDGTIPVLEGDTDVEQLVWLLEVCRQRGYALGPTVQVGTVIAQVTDLRLAEREGLVDLPNRTKGDVWKEHGHDPEQAIAEGTTGR